MFSIWCHRAIRALFPLSMGRFFEFKIGSARALGGTTASDSLPCAFHYIQCIHIRYTMCSTVSMSYIWCHLAVRALFPLSTNRQVLNSKLLENSAVCNGESHRQYSERQERYTRVESTLPPSLTGPPPRRPHRPCHDEAGQHTPAARA
jgi:hypothetical protein